MLKKSSGLALLVVASALSPFATAVAADGGVLISRTNSETWQVRLVGGTQAEQFSGIVESSAAFGSATPASLESADSAKLLSSNQLGLNFSVAAGGSDAATFTVSAEAKLCLRDTGSSGVQLYRGDSLEDAIPVSAPVALSGADACGDTVQQLAALATTTRKYHKGHYIALMRSMSTQSTMAASIKPGVKGFLKRYTWRSLEPSQGSYNFTTLQSDLAWAQSRGLHLIVMIEDKTFLNEVPAPNYLANLTVRNRQGGWTMLRWNSTVVTRYNALVKAIGQKFDSNPAFEGISTQESAPSIDESVLTANGYTPEKYRDALINMLSTATQSLPTSRVFWYMNFFPRNQNYIASVASAVASKGVIMGGPDVMPDDDALQTRTYPFYDQFYGKMPLFGQVEPMCYSHEHETSAATKYWTMLELYKYAKAELHVNYMFWVRMPNASPRDSYDYNDALPVIANNQTLN